MNIVDPAVPPHITSANKFSVAVLCGLVLFSISLASWYGTWTLVLLVAAPAALLPILFIVKAPGALFTRMMVGAAVMIFCALNIDQSHGLDELHFGIFVLPALSVIYQDWRVIVGAAAVIAVHHLLFNYLQAAHYRVWCFIAPGLAMVFVHAAYVVVESAALCYLAVVLNKKTSETASSRARMQESSDSMRSLIAQAELGMDAMTAASVEVRSLAQRTSEASKEIKGLIQDSMTKLENGTRLVDSSGQALANIVKSVKQMGKMVGHIATASAEQSTGIEQVNAAMTQIDRVTQTNSAQTEKLAETSQSLSQQSAGLMDLVREFNSSGDGEQVPERRRLRA